MRLNRLVLATLIYPLALTALHAQEQDSTMNQSMRLERDFSPIVQQKNKIDRQPAAQEVQPKKHDATFAQWQVESVRSSEIGVVPAGQVIASPSREEEGYVEICAGKNNEIKGGIKFDEFRVDANGFLTTGNLDLPHKVFDPLTGNLDKKSWKSKLLSGDILGTFSRELGNEAQFDVHVGATGTCVNTFNYQFLGNAKDTLLKSSDKPGRQSWGQIRGDVGYESDQFKFQVAYDYTKLSSGDSLSRNWTTNTLMLKGTYGWYEQDNWQASVDLDLGGVFGKEKTFFVFRPTLHLSLIPDATAWKRYYFDLGFGCRRESLLELMNQLPLAVMGEEYKGTTDAMDLHIGYEDNDQGYLRWGGELQVAFAKDALCAAATSTIDSVALGGLYMNIFQKDDFRFGLVGHVDYEYNRYFAAKANFQLVNHTHIEANLGKPNVNMNLHVFSHPGKVDLDFGMDFGFGSKVKLLTREYDLGPDIKLSARADYQYNEELRFYLSLLSWMGGDKELMPAVPHQVLAVQAGARWTF